MPEQTWIGNNKNKPLTSDELPKRLENDAVNSEGKSITTPSSNGKKSENSEQIDSINNALKRPGVSSSVPAKSALLNKKFKLMNGYSDKTGSTVGISFEDIKLLLQQMQRFQETMGGDWTAVMSQWQNLQNCWQDRQYDRFEPFFENLCRTYDQCEQQCQEHTQFLESRIRSCEDATATINF